MATRAEVMASITRHLEQTVTEIAVNLQGALQAVTPVDTGFARSNWQLGVGAPPDGTVSEGDTTIAALVDYKLEQGPAFVVNNASYIQRLNAGSSSQAPAAFVEAAIAETVAEAGGRS